MKKKGFSHRVSRELLEMSSKTTIEQRMEWLEQMQDFIYAAVPPEQIRRWEEYKRGLYSIQNSKLQAQDHAPTLIK